MIALDADNLVYCCTACNTIKGDFWTEDQSPSNPVCLLQPERDAREFQKTAVIANQQRKAATPPAMKGMGDEAQFRLSRVVGSAFDDCQG